MPFFSNKFSPKRTTPRKTDASVIIRDLEHGKSLEELGLEVGPIKITLGDQKASFDKGQWIPESGPVSGTHKENQKLRKYVQKLEEENNLLKLKFEILLDMLTQTTAEFHLREKEIEHLKKLKLGTQGKGSNKWTRQTDM
ncbi:protein chibby homolog 1 [Anabrus simplex]|uniref:protein chibby homolog 1 n=1 Tax=Anabrus simplex TaxID=316456 RepID=UPI0035A29AC9